MQSFFVFAPFERKNEKQHKDKVALDAIVGDQLGDTPWVGREADLLLRMVACIQAIRVLQSTVILFDKV